MQEITLDNMNLFAGMPPDQLDILRPLLMRCDQELDDVIFEQGELADSLYIVACGEVSILYKPDDGPELVVARVRPEAVIGWSAALGSPLYTSSAVCLTRCCLYRLRGEDLRWLCDRYPPLGQDLIERLATALADRLHSNYGQVVTLLKQSLHVNLRKSATIKVTAAKSKT